MADTNANLRGHFYTANGVVTCPSFSQCPRCFLCSNYNPAHEQCLICESRKSPKLVCGANGTNKCTPANRQSARFVMHKFKRPLFVDPNVMKGTQTTSVDVSEAEDWDERMEDLSRIAQSQTGVPVRIQK